jgi:predicted PurR-regulated permease PerM
MSEAEPKHVLRSNTHQAVAPPPAGETPPTPARPEGAPEAPAEPVVVHTAVDVRSAALRVIAVLAVILVLQYAQAVLIPIVLGVLISYGLAPLVRSLERVHIPRSLGAVVAVTVFVGTLGFSAYSLSDDAMAIVSSIPEASQRIRQQLRVFRRAPGDALEKVQKAAKEIDKAAQEAAAPTSSEPPPPKGVQKVEVIDPTFKASDYLWYGGIGLVGFAGQFVLVLFLVYFALVTGDLFKRKLVKIAGPTLSNKKATLEILNDISEQIATFIRVQILTSLIVAIATGFALWLFGIEQYIVWGLLAGVFNSIPYIGPVIVTVAIGIVSLLAFNNPLKTTYICAVTFAITSLEGFLLTPVLMGRAAQMNPVAIFVGLLFWSWIWGIWGTVLAVPMLMIMKAFCDHIEDLQPIGELLGE